MSAGAARRAPAHPEAVEEQGAPASGPRPRLRWRAPRLDTASAEAGIVERAVFGFQGPHGFVVLGDVYLRRCAAGWRPHAALVAGRGPATVGAVVQDQNEARLVAERLAAGLLQQHAVEITAALSLLGA